MIQIELFKDVFFRLLKKKAAAISMLILAIYFTVAICGESYSIYCSLAGKEKIYAKGNFDNRFQPPSTDHLMGTDYRGRDVFIRGLFGTVTAVKVGVTASLISVVLGVALGACAGYFGGRVDAVAVWLYSTFASMPTLLFILAFALLVTKGFLYGPLEHIYKGFCLLFHTEPGMMAVYLGIGLTGWDGLCRVVRAETMKLRETAYVQAAKSLGFSWFRIITKHVIPNLFHLVIIYFTMRFAYAVMTEVIVSYLGVGVQFEPSWGLMISDGQERLWRGIWWEVATATGFMFFMVLPLHLLGDALRDVLDPRLRF